ncbi:MAG: hypothetical protein P1U56_25480 [Saprospiraceae bacterium]|nr:hypothetical protein [Saprospiraceae bacterium]
MKIKFSLPVLVFILLLSFISCQKESVIKESQSETQNIQEISSLTTFSLTSQEICEELSNDPNLALLFNLLTEDNFVYNSIQQNSTNESHWNDLNSFLKNQNPTSEVNPTDVEFYIGIEYAEFLNYSEDVTNVMSSLISSHLSNLNNDQVLETFDCAISSYLNSRYLAATNLGEKLNKNKPDSRASCCKTAKDKYLLCIDNKQEEAATIFVIEVIIGIGGAPWTGGMSVFVSIGTGTVSGGLAYLAGKKGCKAECAFDVSSCFPSCPNGTCG